MKQYVVIKSFDCIDEGTILTLEKFVYDYYHFEYEMYCCRDKYGKEVRLTKDYVTENPELFAPLIKEYDNRTESNYSSQQ